MLLSGNGTFRVNLGANVVHEPQKRESFRTTHNLAVQEVFADHHCVDRRRVLKRQEGEAPRTTSGVAHNGAGFHLAKLRKVLSEVL